MTDYKFAGALYSTERHMLDAVADAFLTAGGLNSEAMVNEFLRDNADGELADEALREWGGDWDRAGLVAAFNRYRTLYAARINGDAMTKERETKLDAGLVAIALKYWEEHAMLHKRDGGFHHDGHYESVRKLHDAVANCRELIARS